MNAPISGPKGYEYQYLMSCYLVLLLMDKGNVAQAYIEKVAREDLALALPGGGAADFQFKNRKSQLDLKTLAACLVKFDAGKDDSNVLSKLESGVLDSFCLVTSARSKHFAEKLGLLLQDGSLHNRVSQEWDTTVAAELISAMSNVFGSAATALQKRRKNFVTKQLSKLSMGSVLESVLAKVSIMENARKEYVISRIKILLSGAGIPHSSQELIIFRMVEVVQSVRGNNGDIVSAFSGIISRSAGNIPQTLPGYKIVGSEKILEQKLEQDRYLLLTGVSLCGKSQMAIYLINSLFGKLGELSCRVTGTISEAENFLLDNSPETRLCLIEDPFGQGEATSNLPGYHRLTSLVDQVKQRDGKYLMVTSNRKALSGVTKPNTVLSEWQNLTVINRDFLVQIWRSVYCTEAVDLLGRKVEDMLMTDNPELLLQPGQLQHISRHSGELNVISESTVRQLANFKSLDVEHNIRAQDRKITELMLLLAVTGSYISGISRQEFSYLLETEREYRPGINSSYSMKVYGGESEEEVTIDKYRTFPELEPEFLETLDEVIRIGYVRFVENEFRFLHPIYEDGAKGLLNTVGNPFLTERMLYIFEKGIGSLDPSVAIHTVNSLYLVADYFHLQDDILKKLFEIAKTAMRSTYVVVRDEALQFLLRYFTRLPGEMLELLEKKVRKNALKSSDYFWQDGIAYIPNREQLSFSDAFSDLFTGSDGDEIWELYRIEKAYLAPRDAYRMLEFLIEESRKTMGRINIDIAFLLPFLRYEQFFIVEAAAYLLTASMDDDNFLQLAFVMAEDRPTIKFQILKGLIRSYPYFIDQDIQKQILAKMLNLMDDHFVALACFDLMTQFNAGHGGIAFNWGQEIEESVKEKIWMVWAILNPVMVRNLPKQFRLNDGRFKDAIINAKVTDSRLLFELCHSWILWLYGHFEKNGRYETNTSGSISFMYRHYLDKISKEDREVLTDSALNVPNLYFHARILRIVTHKWTCFSKGAQRVLYDRMLLEPAAFKSVILTAQECPDYLMDHLSGATGFAAKDVAWIIENLDQNLLQYCLVTLFANPSMEQMEYGYFTFWNPVLTALIERPDHNGFVIAVRVFILHFLGYHFTDEPMIWPAKGVIAGLLSTRCNDGQLKMILVNLMENIGMSESRMITALDFLFSHISRTQQDMLGEILAENTEMIFTESKSFPKQIIDNYLNAAAPIDLTIKRTYRHLVKGSKNPGSKTLFAALIHSSVSSKQIRRLDTLQLIRRWRDENPDHFNSGQSGEIDNYFDYFFSIVDRQQKLNSEIAEMYQREWYLH